MHSSKTTKQKNIISGRYYLAILAILTYLLFDTGLHSDDYIVINSFNNYSFLSFINQNPSEMGTIILNPVSLYGLWWPYSLIGYENQIIYDLIKILSSAISVYFIFKFFGDYLPHGRAFIASFVFVLYPLHDTTLYWYMTLQYMLAPAFLLYSHHLLRNNKIQKWFITGMVGSFLSYASPPYAFGLAVIFLIEKKLKKAIVFVTPGVLFVAYYFWMKINYEGVEKRINSDLNIIDFIKQLLSQLLSFIETSVGPSYWLKVFYAIESISLSSIIVVSLLVFGLFKVKLIHRSTTFPKSLFFGLVAVLLLSFCMFALTGLYNHSAFNLGNRTTVYGSLLISFFLATLLPINKKSAIFLLLIFLLPVFGLSDHWKSWNSHQKNIIENVKNNQDLAKIEHDSTLIVTGNIYSKLGPFSHIEFFSAPWTIEPIFKGHVKSKNVVALNPYTAVDNGTLIDQKFGVEYSLLNKIYVYDSNANLVKEIYVEDIPQLMLDQPKLIRHWVQLFKDTWIQDVIIWLSPRLVYLFE